MAGSDERAGESGGVDSDVPAAPEGFEPAETAGPGPDDGARHRKTIGPYKLLQQLGEGGMGTVFLAEQSHPVRRRVALKIVKAGMDSRRVLSRFDAERQALALMDHPNIARVLDAGTTGAGRPYFVMELVKGVPITQYCDAHRLTPRQRLELFIPVCQAVQHAHQKGVIHRDLKPSNVMVCLYDGEAVPKVIDFGVAKATGPTLTEQTLFTEFGQVVGTLEYMSPEQAELNQLDVDTRSDIYSLGVLLYELLTGTTPLQRKRLKQSALVDLLRAIREEEPPKPSTRLSTVDGLPAIAASRGLEPKKLNGVIRGELDWIVMRALEKDRSRRYETANGLAMDVRRYLDDEPVAACPPSAGYRVRKFARRNRRALVTLAVSLALLLIGPTVGMLVYALQQRRLAGERAALVVEKERLRQETAAELYEALVGQAEAMIGGRAPGYRGRVWKRLHDAVALEVPGKDVAPNGHLVLACLGDPIGLDPVKWPDAKPARETEVPDHFREVYEKIRTNYPRDAIAISPGGNWLAHGSQVLWLRDKDSPIANATPSSHVHDLAFTPDGTMLVAGCENGTVTLSVPELRQVSFNRGNVVNSVAVHPGGRHMATFGASGRIERWSLNSNRRLASIEVPDWVDFVEFDAEGKYLLGMRHQESGQAKAAWGWPVDRTPEKLYLDGHQGGVPAVAFSPDGRLLASVSKDRTVRVWDAATGRTLHVCRGHKRDIQTLAFTPDGRWLASGDWGGSVRLWDPNTGTQLTEIKHPGQVWRLDFDSAGHYMITAGFNGARCWAFTASPGTAPALEPLASFELGAPGHNLYDMAIHPGGSRFAVATRDTGAVYVCDLATRVPPTEIGIAVSPGPFTLAFDPAGDLLRVVVEDGEVLSWDLRAGRVADSAGRAFWARSLAVSPDGRWAAGPGPAQDQISIHDLTRDVDPLVLPYESNDVWGLDWSPDGTRLGVGLSDGGVAIWDLAAVRAQLAEFGVAMDSTASQQTRRPEPLADAAFRKMVEVNTTDDGPYRRRVSLLPPAGFSGASWIWHSEPRSNATLDMPLGSRFFRRTFLLPSESPPKRAVLWMTVDNAFVLYVNGTQVFRSNGATHDWRSPKRFDLTKLLVPGRNVLAIEGENGPWDGGTNPAGVIAWLAVEAGDGADAQTGVISTDGQWKSSDRHTDSWQRPDFDDGGWGNAAELARYGDPPWGKL